MSCSLSARKRGVLFTLDSIFALLIGLIILTSVIYNLHSIEVNNWSETNINELGMDYLTMLENDDTLKQTVSTANTYQLKVFLNIFVRQNICAKIKIYDSSDRLLMLETRTGCFDNDIVFNTRRSFVVDGVIYYAVFEGWYDK